MAKQATTFKQFDKTNSVTTQKGSKALSVTRNGVFCISKLLADEMGLKEGDGVVLLQDETEPSDWFLCMDKDAGFTVRKSSSTGYLFNAVSVAEALFTALDFDERSGRMMVADATTIGSRKVWALLTSSLKHRTRKAKD